VCIIKNEYHPFYLLFKAILGLSGILLVSGTKYMLCIEVDPDVHDDVCWSQLIANIVTLWYYCQV
jgi:hypothetical protein